MKAKLLAVLLNPFFIAAVLSGIIIYYLPEYNSKYKLEIESINDNEANAWLYFKDLNGNGLSEKIIVRENTAGQASYIIKTANNDIVDQWNFESYFPSKSRYISIFDIDDNGYPEIYNITQRTDSLFLNIVEPLKIGGSNKRAVFVDTIVAYNGSYAIYPRISILPGKFNDGPGVVFSLNAGYAGSPRNVYSYNLENESISKSPHMTNTGYLIETADVDGDDLDEILVFTSSNSNHIDSAFTKKTDYSLWLTVLDDDLDFLFPQIEYAVPFSDIIKITAVDDNIFLMVKSAQPTNRKSSLLMLSNEGKIIQQQELSYDPIRSYFDKEEGLIYNFDSKTGHAFCYDFEFNFTFKKFLEPKVDIEELDIDADGLKEWVTTANRTNKITVYQRNFEDGISFQLPEKSNENLRVGTRNMEVNSSVLWVQQDRFLYNLSYEKNPMYYMSYVLYLWIYIGILIVVYLIMKAQSYRELKKRALETQIAELQLVTIKNKIDPHFIFNAINAIGDMTLTENVLEADQFIVEFSKLMRNTLEGSDKISHPLEAELEYVKSYILLQHLRYNKQFDYFFDIDPNTNLQIPVPRQVLFTYVENAIKHGMAKKGEKLEINIKVQQEKNNLLLFIEDTAGGVGNSHLDKELSTGSGLKIMEELFVLYTKLTKKAVSYSLHNRYNSNNQLNGLRVAIKINI